MDELARRYHGQVEFWFVYGPEAHPWTPPFLPAACPVDVAARVAPGGTPDRATAARIFADNLHVKRRLLVDGTGENSLRKFLLGDGLYHPIVAVNPSGRVVFASQWLEVTLLNEFLTAYLAHPEQTAPVSYDGLPPW